MSKQNTKWSAYAILNRYGDVWTPEIFKTREDAYEYLNSSSISGLQNHTVAPVEVRIKLTPTPDKQ